MTGGKTKMNKKSNHSTDPEEKLLRESPAEASEDSQNDSKPQTADTSCDMNVKFKKEKKQSTFLTQILGLDLLVLEIQLLFT